MKNAIDLTSCDIIFGGSWKVKLLRKEIDEIVVVLILEAI
jgi:hypothetical protein